MVSEKYIASRIRQLRKDAGMDVETVGAGVGRSGKTVSAWETGRNVPSAEMLISICRFFNVNIDYFYPKDVTSSGAQSALAPFESELIAIFRSMNAEGRARLMEQAEFLAARHPLNTVDSMGA